MPIIIATAVVAVIGLLIGFGLVFAGKKFHVDVDERVGLVRDCLPGNNCGACGFAGCDAVAEAIVNGTAPVNACPVNNAAALAQIGEIMGQAAEAPKKRTAFVHCKGDCTHTNMKFNYVGMDDCRAAVGAGLSPWNCDYGCIGLGSCTKVCQYGAIRVENGVAVVDSKKCVGCGMCAKACPKGLITVMEDGDKFQIRCSSHDRGADVMKVCNAGCIGCTLCTKQCENQAVTMDNNLAVINPELCVGCGKCAEKCPKKVIDHI